ncbi:MAG TPA: serine/threonine-protein kinase [Pirellulales bacterium]
MAFAFRRVFNTDVVLAPAHGPGPLPCRLGRWRLDAFLGGGPLSKTYRAVRTQCWPVEPHLPRHAAIKILRKRWSSDPLTLAQFASESAIATLVRHPRLATVVETQLHRAPYYLVLPWLCGATLADLVQRRRATGTALPLSSILRWLRQTAEALDAIHSAGWIHADVKPANVLVDPADDATLLDLGFARRVRSPDDCCDGGPGSYSSDPLRSTVVGTPFYMSPEMSASPVEADSRSDLYSLGATAFELLAGRPPFTTRVPWKLIEEHRKEPAPLELLRNAPGALVTLVADLLAKHPSDRPATAGHVAERLQWIEDELDGSVQ